MEKRQKRTVMARVVANEQVAPGVRLIILDAPEICASAMPGQFVHIRCGRTLDPLLRRPLSIHAVAREKGLLALLYQLAGLGTALLAGFQPGEVLDVLGPLGHGFTLPQSGRSVAVAGGGIGIAPMIFLLQELSALAVSSQVLTGARSKEQLLPNKSEWDILRAYHFNLPEPQNQLPATGTPGRFVLHAATDDGSFGHHGPVTDLIVSLLDEGAVDRVYACGPRGMLRIVCQMLVRRRIPGQVSLEERMGCGVGACLSCACKITGAHGQEFYRRVCVDGPVFAADTVSWDD